MNIYEVIRKRKSIRSFKDKPVEKEKLIRVLEAAHLAPSASNRQEWRFVVVQDKTTLKQLSAAANNQKPVGEAGAVIACCAETDGHLMSCGQASYPIDVAIAMDHITLVAVEEGLGTCWIGAFSENKVKGILSIPEQIRVVELLTIGYPVDDKEIPKSRLPMAQIVKWEKW